MTEHVDATLYSSRIRALLRSGGSLRTWPRRTLDRWILLHSAARVIRSGEHLGEREASARLQDWLAGPGTMLGIDHANLRRALVDEGFWDRDDLGRDYRPSERHTARVTFDAGMPAAAEVLEAAIARRRVAAAHARERVR